MARLDFFLVSTDIHARTVKAFMSFGYRTVHSFLVLKLILRILIEGRAFGNLTPRY